MRIYVAAPMRGIPEFNFPAIHREAARLRNAGHMVFSPADHDIEMYGDFSKGKSGDYEEIKSFFDVRKAFGEDLAWICSQAECLALLPGWEKSTGAFAEWAVGRMLNLEMMYL